MTRRAVEVKNEIMALSYDIKRGKENHVDSGDLLLMVERKLSTLLKLDETNYMTLRWKNNGRETLHN